MFAAPYVNAHGVTVQHTESGVLYTHNGHTMSYDGDGTDGEVFVDDAFFAYYNKDEHGTMIEDADGNEITLLYNDEDSYERYALSVLSAL